MKHVETLADGRNFSAISVGKLSELSDYVLELGPDVKIPGKVFGGAAASCTPTRSMRNCTSSSAAGASSRWTDSASPWPKGPWCG